MEDQFDHPTKNNEVVKTQNEASDILKDVLVAGFKVRNKAGGPDMLLLGFIIQYPEGGNFSFEPNKITSITKNWHTAYHKREIFPKVSYNRNNVPTIVYVDPEKKEVFNYWFFRSVHADITRADSTSNTVFAVCKRWSGKEEDYVHTIIGLHELEIIQE